MTVLVTKLFSHFLFENFVSRRCEDLFFNMVYTFSIDQLLATVGNFWNLRTVPSASHHTNTTKTALCTS